MPNLAVLLCGVLFGCGLIISGMTQPSKVLGFLDVLGAWDPTLLVVMAAALVVSSAGYAWVRRLDRPYLAAPASRWRGARIDMPLIAGAALFGVGWGLVGLCPGPALVNLATFSLPVVAFVAAMAAGMVLHDLLRHRSSRRSEAADDITEAPAAADA